MARRREQDPTERYPFGRRRFLQGAAATTAAAFPILRAGAARAGGGCDLYGTPPSFMGVVPDPASVLGFPIGVDREVTSAESNDYLQAVVAASNRSRGGVVGTSVQGRTIRYAVLSHPDNVTVSGLEAVRQANLEIRDPSTRQRRVDELARTTPAFAWIEANVHGSEESGADAALQLLYELADRDDCVVETLLANLVIVVIPVQNPDGRELDQRRNGYGFDLNRDVFARTQVETDDRVELMRTYPPLLLLDHHEFGYYRAFFPPNADPVFHEVPEQVMRQIDDLYGPAMARLFHRNDWPFFNGGIYDFLAPQFNDTGASLGFNGVGMTLEVYNGSPLEKRFDRQLGIQWACLWQAAKNRRRILRAWHDASVTAVEQGKAGKLEPNKRYFMPDLKVRTKVPTEPLRHYFVLDTPRTHDEVSLLIRRLQRMDVEVYRLDEDTTVGDFHELASKPSTTARTSVQPTVPPTVLPPGTVWIPMAQRQKHWIQAVMGEQPYCPTYYTYGLAGWSFPLSMNLEAGSSGLTLRPSATLLPPEPQPSPPSIPPGAPTIGLYRMSSGGYAQESFGATQWLFDTVWNVPYTYLEAPDIAAGALAGIDVLVTPGGDWPTALRRLGDTGAQALRRWVRNGGRYVGYRGGGAKLAQAIGLTTASMRDPIADVPGSVVRVELDRDHPLAEGIGRWCWILFDDDDVIADWSPGTAPVTFPRGPRNGFYVSGLADGERQLYGTPAVIDESARNGRVVLMPSDPFFDGHMEGSRKILWNAIFGPDPAAPARIDVDAYERAVDRARRAALAEPSWPMAIRVSVATGDEAEVRRILRGFRARYVVRHDGDVARFRIRNPRELSLEEHPWAIDLALALQRARIEVHGFRAR
jgi:hypothetical protein